MNTKIVNLIYKIFSLSLRVLFIRRQMLCQFLELIDGDAVLDLLVLDLGLELLDADVQLLDRAVAPRQLVRHVLNGLLKHQVRILQRLNAERKEEN